METKHESVLMDEALASLRINPSDTVLDATLGGAGHFTRMLAQLKSSGTIIGIDADSDAIERTEQAVARSSSPATSILVNDNFRNLESILSANSITHLDKALFDLGWSSFHLESGRGFSFRTSEPLLMTYGAPVSGQTAADLVNTSPEETLADIFFTYGEERFARPIARAIVRSRKEAAILTTDVLAEVVTNATPSWYQHRRLHPATKVFQALRIAVNDELGALREGLGTAMNKLSVGGRVAVITFHSIEDRIVKNMFRDAAHEGAGMLVTKKPLTPTMRESMRNPRARSAKLRVFESTGSVVLTSDAISNSYSFL